MAEQASVDSIDQSDLLSIVTLPLRNPSLNPLDIALHLIRSITRELNNYLFVVRISRFLE